MLTVETQEHHTIYLCLRTSMLMSLSRSPSSATLILKKYEPCPYRSPPHERLYLPHLNADSCVLLQLARNRSKVSSTCIKASRQPADSRNFAERALAPLQWTHAGYFPPALTSLLSTEGPVPAVVTSVSLCAANVPPKRAACPGPVPCPG